ncbi:MAG: tetratricopeptide repeat protein [Bacteroidia bacterium]
MKVIRQFKIVLLLVVFYGRSQSPFLDSLKNELKYAKNDTSRCKILHTLVENEFDDNVWPSYNEELIKITEAKALSLKKSDKEYLFYQKYYAAALNNIGYLAQLQGLNSKSIDYYKKSLRIQESIEENRSGTASTLNNIGFVYYNQGDIPQALNYYSKALKIEEDIGNKKGMAQVLNNIAMLYEGQGENKRALDYYNKSLKLRIETGDKPGLATSYNNISDLYYKMEDVKNSIDYIDKSLKIYEEVGHKQGTATALYNKASIYNKINENTKALALLEESLKIYEEINDKEGIAVVMQFLGLIYAENNNLSKGLQYTLKSMQISKELGYPYSIKRAAKQLVHLYTLAGNYKLALENYQLYVQMKDSLNNLETQKATIQQQTKYEFDKKQAVADEKHASELTLQKEKAEANKKKQNIIIVSVSIVLLLVVFFSVILFNRFKTTQKQKQLIEQKEKETQEQKHIIEEKQKEILDSINYAKRIQYTLLAHDQFLLENLQNYFTLFNPKDIVSGDFYWAAKRNDKFYLAVCDSTGHGVPGAFMSLLSIGFLSEAINERKIEKPNEIFDYVRMKLINTISKEEQKDGFDGILVCFDRKNSVITYAAANNSPILISNGERLDLKSDRMPVGIGERKENFTLKTIPAKKGDMLYLYTDGYADQFGGPRGKKFKYKQLNEILMELSIKPLSEQRLELKKTFDSWKGEQEQVDDVCIIGVKV